MDSYTHLHVLSSPFSIVLSNSPWNVSDGRSATVVLVHHSYFTHSAFLFSFRPTVDTVVLGGHDLRFMAAQTIPVDEVFSHPHDGTFPPTSDLTLIKLSVPARFGNILFQNGLL